MLSPSEAVVGVRGVFLTTATRFRVDKKDHRAKGARRPLEHFFNSQTPSSIQLTIQMEDKASR